MSEWWIDDDPDALGETLSLLASWDTEERAQKLSSSSSTSDEARESQVLEEPPADALATEASRPPRTTTLTITTSSRPRRVNATRERRKGEIETLRGLSRQLEEQLRALQWRRQQLLKPHFNGEVITSTAPVWENMARRQFQSRRRAEEFNAKLRAAVMEQKLVADGLMNAIQSAMQRQTLQEKRRLPIDVSQRMSEEEQLLLLEENHRWWQGALALSSKFERGELDFMDTEVVEADGWTATLNLYSSYVLPYTVDTVANLLWSIFQAESSGTDADDADIDKYVHEHKTAGDLIIAVFSMESTMGGASARQGTISGKWVCKQTFPHGCDQRLVSQIWQYELTGFRNELDGITVVEESWLRVVNATEVGHTRLTGPVTVLQHVRRCYITFNRGERVDHNHIKTVTEMFKEAVTTELKYARETVEDALMTQALRVKKDSRS